MNTPILIIEDCPLITTLLKWESKALNIEAYFVDNLREALIILENHPISLIILDNYLEKEIYQGVDIARFLRHKVRIPIILATADTAVKKPNAIDLIVQKPINLTQILKAFIPPVKTVDKDIDKISNEKQGTLHKTQLLF